MIPVMEDNTVRLVLMYERVGLTTLIHLSLCLSKAFKSEHMYNFKDFPAVKAVCGAEFPYTSWDLLERPFDTPDAMRRYDGTINAWCPVCCAMKED